MDMKNRAILNSPFFLDATKLYLYRYAVFWLMIYVRHGILSITYLHANI